MVKRILLGAFFMLLLFPAANAQNKDPVKLGRNGVYADLYMLRPDFSDGFVSINYERVTGKKQRTQLRVGLYPDFQSTVSFPFTISWMTGPARKHHFEYGLGAVFRIEHYVNADDPTQIKEWFYDVPAFLIPLMYRYQNSHGLFLRGGINLFLSWPTLPSPSIGVGYKF
jgi:hypothetical protein